MRVNDWEFVVPFDPVSAANQRRREPQLVTRKGSPMLLPPTDSVTAEQLWSQPELPFSLDHLPFRDPDTFVAGGLHLNSGSWQPILAVQSAGVRDRVTGWLTDGVRVQDFFRPFHGCFKGQFYDLAQPPQAAFPNPPQCAPYATLIAQTLEERLRNGSMSLLGKVGDVEPPHLLLPFVVEPTKPRLCHDERFLNLWITDNPFRLDTLKAVPPMVEPQSFLTSCDEKSAYDNVLLHESSRTYFGVQFAGFYLVYNTLPFGWKASPYVYQTIGMCVTSYLRAHHIQSLLYIDDRLTGSWTGPGTVCPRRRASIAIYCTCQILLRLGYTIALIKSVLDPTQCLVWLGMWVDSFRQMFRIPDPKREKFALLRQQILSQPAVTIVTLQKLMGKCISFTVCVPGAKIRIRSMARAISQATRNSRLIPIAGVLKSEIEGWEFLDSFDDWIPWRDERHVHLTLATDSSTFAWGAQCQGQNYRDYWDSDDLRPIHLKEADALFRALQAQAPLVRDSRVQAYVDNMAVVHAWHHEGCKDMALNSLITQIFELTTALHADLKVVYVRSADNPADMPSRLLSPLDSMLSTDLWSQVEAMFGPHTFDLMALDSNCMKDASGATLGHYTPFPTPASSGVDVFAHLLSGGENYYVFPPFCMIPSLVRFLLTFRSIHLRCTMVLPRFSMVAHWWPTVHRWATSVRLLAPRGHMAAVLVPSRSGFVSYPDLPYDLYVARFEL